MSDKADNAIKGAKAAHFSIVALCFILLVVSAFSDGDGYLEEAIAELHFLKTLDDKYPAEKIIIEVAEERAREITPKDVAILLSKNQLFVEWEEGDALYEYRDVKTRAARIKWKEDGYEFEDGLNTVDLTDEVLDTPEYFFKNSFDDDSVPNVESCIERSEYRETSKYDGKVYNWDREARDIENFSAFIWV